MSAKHEWLNLIEVSGPFLAVPVLREVFPQGLEELDSSHAKRLRSAYEEWRDAVDGDDADRNKLHAAWIDEVLRTALEADDQLLKPGKDVPASVVELPEHDTTIAPELVFVDPTHGGAVLAPIHVFPPDTDLSASMKFGGLSCSPGDRMALHLRALNVPFGMVTNGERWMLVHAPTGQVATFASWYARIWGQEPATLRAFTSLLGVRRFFVPAQDRLPALFERSLKHQDEVTDALGDQVRRAIEVLVQALDRADQDRNRELLRDVRPQELYEAGLTVMMRLVFLLAAEERGLLLLGEPRYDSFYAVSTLRMQLRAESDEILERRRAAWSRLLAVFRAVFGGIDHPTLRLPAMGGSLFDPDRFPFLEGRLKGTSWRQHRAEPLPIDDRTVLLLLEAIQTFEGRTLSYRALDVEQIGHVYEGLLERTVSRVEDVTLELEAGASAKDARVTLGELESARLDGKASVTKLLVDRSKRSPSAIEKELAAEVEPQQSARLLSACRGDVKLRDRLEPYVRLLRTDPWGYPLVHPKGAFVVVLGADRRETGTHYTPKSLTERIVEETLTPLVYDGPAKGAPRAEWKLKTPEQLLDLKICDPAMGSGAFLVQACRFLSARLAEAWSIEEAAGRVVDLTGQLHEPRTRVEIMPPGVEVRAENARRIVAERCLYGVDLNPLAVELAKLSLWLVTLSKGRPFGFLDHNLRRGDSLLGISRLEQLTELSLDPSAAKQRRLFGKAIEDAVAEAVELRRKLHEIPNRDIRDVEAMATLDADARKKLEAAELLANAFIGAVFRGGSAKAIETRLAALGAQVDQVVQRTGRAAEAMRHQANDDLGARRPFHWALDFADVFAGPVPGFDAVIGNPPWASYSGRQSAPIAESDTRYYGAAFRLFGGWKALHSLFIERASLLTKTGAALGLLLPAQVADLDGYGPARELLREWFDIAEPLPDFGENAFVGVIQPSCAIIALNKSPQRKDSARSQAAFRLSKDVRQVLQADATASAGSDPKEAAASLAALLIKMARFPPPPAAAFGDPGVHTGNCSKVIILSKRSGICAPVREGKNVHAYSIDSPSKWIRLDYNPAEGEYFTVRELASYVAWPILIRQTATRPIACLHAAPTYFRNSVLACRGLEGLPHEVAVAWLNSSAIAFFHSSKVREANQRAFPQVKVKHLRALPLPSFDEATIKQIVSILRSEASDAAIPAVDRLISERFGFTPDEHDAVVEAVRGLE